MYRVAVHPDGLVTFEGLAHTTSLGLKTRNVGRAAYESLASSLAPFRPHGPAQRAECTVHDANAPSYRITWSGQNGSAAVLDHSGACGSPRDTALSAILANAPAQLGIDDLAAGQFSPATIFKPHIFYF